MFLNFWRQYGIDAYDEGGVASILGSIHHCGEDILTGPHWKCMPRCTGCDKGGAGSAGCEKGQGGNYYCTSVDNWHTVREYCTLV